MSRLSPAERSGTKLEVTIVEVNAPLYTHSCGEPHPEPSRRIGADEILDVVVGLDAVLVLVCSSVDFPLPLRARLLGTKSVLVIRHWSLMPYPLQVIFSLVHRPQKGFCSSHLYPASRQVQHPDRVLVWGAMMTSTLRDHRVC
jgi:hypothetical protein